MPHFKLEGMFVQLQESGITGVKEFQHHFSNVCFRNTDFFFTKKNAMFYLFFIYFQIKHEVNVVELKSHFMSSSWIPTTNYYTKANDAV